MKPRHQASRAAIDLIKRFEGCRHRAARLADGRWTIGYGHTRTAREGAEVSETDADALLVYDIAGVVKALDAWVFSPLSQNQFDALVAFVFNIGVENFRSSSVLRRLNEGAMVQAACAMEMWRTADFEGERIVVDALVRRRTAEMALFLTPEEGFVPVPSLIVRPRVDGDQAETGPGSTASLEIALDGDCAEAQRTDEGGPSATLAAAEAVSARLSAIFPEYEADLAIPLPPVVEMQDDAAALEPDLLAEPDPPQAETSPSGEAAPEDEDQPIPMFFHAEDESRRLAWTSASETVAARARKKEQAPAAGLVVMGLAGLIVFAYGAYQSFNAGAQRAGPGGDPVAIGWALGVVGVVMIASAVYLLLRRLGGKRP
jgi:lysozyme